MKRENLELEKPNDIPDHLILGTVRMIKTCEQITVSPEDLDYFIKYNQHLFKSMGNQPLAFVINPVDAFSGEVTRASRELSDAESKGSLKDVIMELGPIVTYDDDLLKYVIC